MPNAEADSLTLGPFVVAEDGGLRPRPGPGQPSPCLRFAWRGRRCEASLDGPDELRLAAIAAWIPSTVKAETPRRADEGRRAALDMLGALDRSLPRGWRLALTPDHRVRVEAQARLAAPTTATTLVAAMVGFALALDPYLDRLESAGAGGAPG